jgi:hypothetical protein
LSVPESSTGPRLERPAAERITAVVLARDEVRHVVPCLRTLRWADDRMVMLDSRAPGSMERLILSAGACVERREWTSWAAQRNAALERVDTAWVFFVDVDERVPLELAEEIRSTVSRAARDGQPVGLWVPRQNLIVGQWVRHAGWHPDYQLRLFRVDRGRYDPQRAVHELVQLDGAGEQLRSHLLHHNYEAWGQLWRKQLTYARAEAAQLHAAGQRARPHNLVLQPLRELRRRYVTLHGYRAGALGASLSLLLAVADLVKYAELLRLGRATRRVV